MRFELQLKPLPGDQAASGEADRHFHWSKFPHMAAISSQPSWKLTLDLVTTSNQRRGSLVVYRIYSHRDLQIGCQPADFRISRYPCGCARSSAEHARGSRARGAGRLPVPGRQPLTAF